MRQAFSGSHNSPLRATIQPSADAHRLGRFLAGRTEDLAVGQDIRAPARAPTRFPPGACYGSAQGPRERLTSPSAPVSAQRAIRALQPFSLGAGSTPAYGRAMVSPRPVTRPFAATTSPRAVG
jgi:hypothetical protein